MSEKGKPPLLEVGVSSLLNLKAEIERAHEESKRKSAAGHKRKPASAVAVSDIRNKGVDQRAQRDLLSPHNDPASESPSSSHVKQALEKKAEIYDALTSGRGISADVLGDEQMSRILDESSVDFVGMMYQRLQQAEGQTDSKNAGSSSRSTRAGNDLVEIVDEFGRSRMVPRSIAHEYEQRPLSQQGSDGESVASASSGLEGHGGAADDLSMRNRGTVHYCLSLSHAEREQQLLALRQLHDDTLANRKHAAASICQKQRSQLDQRRAQLRKSRDRATLRVPQDREEPKKTLQRPDRSSSPDRNRE